MKNILLITIICLVAFTLGAQTQQGYVKTPGRLGSNGTVIPGKRLSGATVQVKGRSAVVSNTDGTFSFPIPANKFFLQSARKQGYVLTDPDATKRQYTYSSNPLIVVMDTQSQQTDNKLANERKIRRTLQRQLQAKEDEIETLKEQNRITQEQYQKKLQELYAEQESNEKLISNMAERYSQIDFDQLDEFNLRISDCILNGRLTEADSLLRSKGDINTRIAELNQHHEANLQGRENLEKSEAMEQKTRNDIAQDCYNYFQKFSMEHKNDSAAYYLELRASLDTTNLEWQNKAGRFIQEYLADYGKAITYFLRGLRQAQGQIGEENDVVAMFLNNLGTLYTDNGDFAEALKYHQKALEMREQVLGPDHPDVASSYHNIGFVYANKGDFDKAMEYYQKALRIQEKFLGSDHLHVAISYNNIGLIYGNLGEYVNAMEYFQRALDIQERVLGTDHPMVATIYNNLGTISEDLGDYSKAMEYFQKALTIREQVLGPKHPDVATSYNAIGIFLSKLGYFEMAMEYFQKALNIQEQVLSTNHPQVADTYNNIGVAYDNLGDYPKAMEYHLTALGIKEQVLGAEHPEVNTSYNNIGSLFFKQGDYDRALEYYKKTMDICERKLGKKHPFVSESYNNIATVYQRQGDYAKALEYYQKALDIQQQVLGNENPNLATITFNIGELYLEQGDYYKALECFQNSLGISERVIGKDSPETLSIRAETLSCEYLVALLSGNINEFNLNHCFIMTVAKGDTPAGQQGMTGEYILLEFADWNQESNFSVLDKIDEMIGKPKDIVVMKDGVIARHHFDNAIGATSGVKQISNTERQQINQM